MLELHRDQLQSNKANSEDYQTYQTMIGKTLLYGNSNPSNVEHMGN